LNKILNVFFLIARLEIYLHDDDNSRRVLVSPVRWAVTHLLLSIILCDTSQSTHVSPWDTTSPFGWSPLYWRVYRTHDAHYTPQCRHPCRQSSAGAPSSHRLRRPPIRCLNSEVIRTCVSHQSGNRCAKVECAQRTSRLPRLPLSQCAPSAHIITRVPPPQQCVRV